METPAEVQSSFRGPVCNRGEHATGALVGATGGLCYIWLGNGDIRRSPRRAGSAVRYGRPLLACRPDGADASGGGFRISLDAVWNIDARSHPAVGGSGRAGAFPARLRDLGRRDHSDDLRRARPQGHFRAGAPAPGLCGVRAGTVQAGESQGLRLSPVLGRIFPRRPDLE